MHIVLASGSPRRSQLLKDAGFEFEILKMDVDESFSDTIPVKDVPLCLAQKKMQEAIKSRREGEIIITADTVVILENKIINKPLDEADGKKILQDLSGKMHLVVSGVCIATPTYQYDLEVTTKVYFDTITEEEIQFYLTHFKPYDKAGAYAIQEWIGITKITKIEGDYYNVVGFPMSKIYPVLKTLMEEGSKQS